MRIMLLCFFERHVGRISFLGPLYIVVFFQFFSSLNAQTASFVASTSATCTPATISYTDKSVGATTWMWDLGNSNTSTVQNPSVNYTIPGLYTVKLTINGGSSSTQQVKVYPAPQPTIVETPIGCEPFSTTLTAVANPVTINGITGGAAVSYEWDFSGALPTVTQNNPVLTLSNLAAGTYNITLKVTDEHGCTGIFTKEKIITVSSKPTADFSFLKSTTCGLGSVAFVGSASVTNGSIASYAWDINNDGTIESTQKDYTHNFTSAGTYDVAFYATTTGLCSSAKVIKQVIFNADNNADFDGAQGCINQSTNFVDKSGANAVKWEWDFDNNGSVDATIKNPTYTFTTAGLLPVKQTVTFNDGCVKTVSKSVNIVGATPDFTYSTANACPPAYTVSFTSISTVSSGSSISNYAWDFDNNGTPDSNVSNPTFSFNAAGTYPVRLIITTTAGCQFTKLINVDVASTTVDYTALPNTGCIPLSTVFLAKASNVSDPIVSYLWDFGDGKTSTESNPIHTYTISGKFDVTLTATTQKGCVLVKKYPKKVMAGAPQTISSITYTQATLCQKSPVKFTANISLETDQLIWDFGDTTALVTRNPLLQLTDTISHTYQKPGVRKIKVEAWSNGCKSITDYELGGIVINEPTVSIKALSAVECAIPTPAIAFENNSISDTLVTIWDWDFGDGNHSALRVPSHIYTKTGDFKVILTANNTKTGCIAKDSTMIYVTTSKTDFKANKFVVCALVDTVQFTNEVVANASSNYKAAGYAWDFGDPSSGANNLSSKANPSHVFSKPGIYSVKLSVTEAHACVDSLRKTNYIEVRGPIVHFNTNVTQICSGASVQFTDSTTKIPTDDADHSQNQYLWTFGDGSTSTDKNPTHVFVGTGNYNVKLQVTDNNNCVNSKTISNSVIVPAIVAGFTTTRTIYCADSINAVQFTGSAVGTVAQYDWDLDGDGVFEKMNGSASESYIYKSAGVYTVQQRVTSNLGCQNIFSKTITIIDGSAGIKLVNPELGCAGVIAIFQATDTASVVTSYLWDFGDGTNSATRNPTHKYSRPGKYTIKLTEVLTGGCTKSTTLPIKISGAVGVFSYDSTPGYLPYTVTFHVDSLAEATEMTWDFGDGVTVSETIAPDITSKTIQHTFTSYGNRLPSLVLKSATCTAFPATSDLTKRMNTSTPPLPKIKAATVSGQTCEKLNVQFTDSSTLVDPRYPITNWDWNFGDGTAHSNQQNLTHAYSKSGTYTVTLTVNTDFIPGQGKVAISQNITVNPLPVATTPTETEVINTKASSSNMVLSSDIAGTTFSWTRTTPKGIKTTQPTSGTGLPIGGIIPGAVFLNDSILPIVVDYTIVPTGPLPTSCTGNPMLASLTVNPNPSVELTKAATQPVMNNDGTFSWKYIIYIKNNNALKLDSIQVFDDMDNVFKTEGCTYEITSITASGSLIANGLYNGSSNVATLTPGGSMASLAKDSIIIEVKVNTHGMNTVLTVFNQARLTGRTSTKSFDLLSDNDLYTVPLEKTPTDIPKVDLVIPDAFSPNHDGINEVFYIAHSETVRLDLEVFNRWGNLVYKSTDYQNDWDGKGSGQLLGQELPSGTYYIVYKIIDKSNNNVMNNGVKYITLRK